MRFRSSVPFADVGMLKFLHCNFAYLHCSLLEKFIVNMIHRHNLSLSFCVPYSRISCSLQYFSFSFCPKEAPCCLTKVFYVN
jgi:hypothetical protein